MCMCRKGFHEDEQGRCSKWYVQVDSIHSAMVQDKTGYFVMPFTPWLIGHCPREVEQFAIFVESTHDIS
jgi:hypothetical protein